MTNLDIQVYNALRELYIPAHIRGYEFLKTALRLNQKPLPMMQLYESVAKEHNTTAAKVERGIRYAIGLIRVDDAGMHRVLGRAGHLSNAEFICTLAESIKIRMVMEQCS